MERLYRKMELVIHLKIPRTTLSQWIHDFNPFIPAVKKGDVIYYKPQTLVVLNTVKKLRGQGYSKKSIAQMLTEQGHATAIEPDKQIGDSDRPVHKEDSMLKQLVTEITQTTCKLNLLLEELKQIVM